jgi:hypothetical protein
MLTITIPLSEGYDEAKGEFVNLESVTLELEHSLVSLSKWESKLEKPFLGKEDKTSEEVLDYIRCMILNPKFSPEVISKLTSQNLDEINAYINAKMTATTFSAMHNKPSREIITAELLYYWMVTYQIPFECQHWHLNRLLTLIKVCSIKNSPPKKMSKRDAAAQQRALNQQRRAEAQSRG